MMKRFVSIMLVMLLLFSLMSVAYANNSDSIDKEVRKLNEKFEVELRKNEDLAEEQIESLLNANYETEKMILEGLIENTSIIKENQLNVIRSSSYTGIPSTVPNLSSGVLVINSANEAKSYCDDNASAEYTLYPPENEVQVLDGLLDLDGEVWAWTGYRFKYTGSSAVSADIEVDDVDVVGNLGVSAIGGSSQLITSFRLYDATDSEYVMTENVKYDNVVYSTGGPNYKSVAGSYDESETESLTPNHTYVVFIITKGYTQSVIGTAYVNNAMLTGTEWDEIRIGLR